MKINLLSKEKRYSQRERYFTNWHKAFAWSPVRVSDDELVWMDFYYRKARYMDGNKPKHFLCLGKEDYLVRVLETKDYD
jgi:hypothetical protein